MSIELTTASEDTIKELKRALGIATIDVLLPNHVFTTVNTVFPSYLPAGKEGIVDFTNFGQFEYMPPLGGAQVNISKIIGASSLVNLKDIATIAALTFSGTTNMPLSAINTLVADLPPTTKIATVNLAGINAVPQSNYRSLTAKGYSVVI